MLSKKILAVFIAGLHIFGSAAAATQNYIRVPASIDSPGSVAFEGAGVVAERDQVVFAPQTLRTRQQQTLFLTNTGPDVALIWVVF